MNENLKTTQPALASPWVYFVAAIGLAVSWGARALTREKAAQP